MKMIKAVVRPEAVDMIVDSLDEAGFTSVTKISAFGRGKQKGIQRGEIHYDELPKTMLIIVVEDDDSDKVIRIIEDKAYTGSFGDGKVFVVPVEKTVTIRTNEEVL